ncbi:hypothetical protein [Xanthomonas citri]|uniref:hypothetical protein n=1 Tax=Xanthomonas citri TaxID=346 RepID=UPI00052B8962|nr:hypothetical protein [Xanthomonas citri]CEH48252.1 conserved hypothetical protein [Xanthomonas citri pv. citri]
MHDDDMQEQSFQRYRCHMRTRSGIFAQYDGYVDVASASDDPHELHRAAVAELRRTAFPDYSASILFRLDVAARKSRTDLRR